MRQSLAQSLNVPSVKILTDGTLDKKLEVYGCSVSKGAKEMILKAGGRVVESS